MAKKKLHELLAVEGDLQTGADQIVQETTNTFTKKPDHFTGFHKTYKPFTEGEVLHEAERQANEGEKAVDETVGGKLDWTAKQVGRWLDVVLQKEATNQSAKADLILDGETIAKDLPATFLLGLETKLKKLRAMYHVIPTLQPGITWIEDPSKGKGIYKAKDPEQKFRTKQTIQHKVLYEATDKHPAQIEKWTENINIGVFATEKWSGMMSVAEKAAVLDRIDNLMRAVKQARQRANTQEAVEMKIADQLFDYINKGK